MPKSLEEAQGFTLIELSIVLVIIGLIVGGVLVGQDLIRAAAVRATITQIEKFNTAVNTFRGKYDALPGDISAAQVSQLGFTVVPTRAGTLAQGDGNGLIEAYYFAGSTTRDGLSNTEAAWFWEDLSANAHLIEGTFNTATATGLPLAANPPSTIIPPAALGGGNFFYVYSWNDTNFFGLSVISVIDANGALYAGSQSSAGSSPGLSVQQAFGIDRKIDDGFPQTGNVVAEYENWPLATAPSYGPIWASGGGVAGPAGTVATSSSSTTCYDNGGVAGATQQYSVETSNGSNLNCALSFQFQ